MTEFFSEWRKTPWWLRFLGKPAWMRDRYASPMVGGGWDGWEFTHNVKVRRGRAAGAGKGEKHWKAAMTEEWVLAIRADPRPQSVIAKDYGIRQQAVSKIKRRQTWAHI